MINASNVLFAQQKGVSSYLYSRNFPKSIPCVIFLTALGTLGAYFFANQESKNIFFDKPKNSNQLSPVKFHESYYPDGSLEMKQGFKDEQPEGPFQKFDPNGQIVEEGEYKNGLLEGPLRFFDPNGKLMTEAEFKNGLLEGPLRFFDPNGKLMTEAEFKNGKFLGEVKEYRKNSSSYILDIFLALVVCGSFFVINTNIQNE